LVISRRSPSIVAVTGLLSASMSSGGRRVHFEQLPTPCFGSIFVSFAQRVSLPFPCQASDYRRATSPS
jgi:hypothetical protein